MERIPIIAGNWKMYKTAKEARDYILELSSLVVQPKRIIMLAVPFTAIHAAILGQFVVGAQNMHFEEEGAFTGEISARMLKEAGAEFVILGHSERRHIFHESNAFINKKVKKALSAGLKAILCVGEKEGEDREVVLRAQLTECLEGVTDFKNLILAYEPVWAIGTGKTATPEMAQEAHKFCRGFVGNEVSILYGGSVKPEVMSTLMKEADIDGVLVGGASLDPKTFAKIIMY